ncbi:hypothetical protein LPJ61_005583, partial [Coemansia biformis]
MDYPFADDTLFRGNSDSLRVLSMNVDSELIAMAHKYRVFESGRFTSLKSVRVKNINISSLKPGAPERIATEFALMVAPTTQILTIEDITMD